MEIIGYLVNEEIIDTQSAKQLGINGEPIVFDNSPYSLEIIRHSSAHLMAQAIKELYPEAKFFVGPVVDEGFYYDLKTTNPIGEEELKTIEKKMKELAKKKIEITKYTTTKTKAQDKYKVDNLKTWVLNNIQSDEVSFYVQGDFEDLCRGPHVPNTGFLYNVKLTKVAGAYLGGDEKNEMLTRIYGISFATKEALDEHLLMIEEAKKRDHRKLGTELELFTFREEIGGGLPVWLPKGARLRGKLERILYKAHRVRGYEPVRGPEILKSDMWMTSGHYQNYGENMYLTKIEEQEYGIK
ncbi:MAG: threonine--tRNA ligase, partial [Epsilonproteobacteria bacterium]|nr:threonine--tRNA ligase [Campylobacterota bacterium]